MSIATDLYLSRRPLAGFVAIGSAWAVYFAQMPVIKANVGASDGAYGIALLLSAFGALAAMWLAPAARRIAGGFSISLGIVMLMIGMLIAGAATHLIMLTVAMFLASVGSGVVDVLVNARVSEIEEDRQRKLMNLNHALYSFAYAGGALSVSYLRGANVPPMPIFVGLAAVLAFLAWCARDVPPHLAPERQADIASMSHVVVVLIGLIVFAAFLAEASTEGWSALHIERTLSGSPAEGALGPAILGLTMGAGRLCGHGLSRRFNDLYLMLGATLMSAAGIALAAFAPSVVAAFVGFAIGGLGISVVAPLALALVGRVVAPEDRLVAISRASVIGYGAFFFGPSMMGLVAEGFGLRAAFVLISCVLCVTAGLLLPMLARRLH